ncbi:hypothetical protein [Acidianus sp. RZ1]|uniref:metallophosphoesterase family protein n=1 Tax=Acidianus sp. RZ1 TaxID=1540082 RepID=UPI0014912DE4|nr:hypothetical protein [Acidianus sp. RZ1]NON62118.1 hypothetical protein [Acidianus sp. RZ1]
MGLFNWGKSGSGKQLRILFASDLHGSDVVFRKFLNAGKMYKADVLIIGGDVAGKALIPILELGGGKYQVDDKVVGSEGLEEYKKKFRSSGIYYTIVDKKEVDELSSDKEKLDNAFKDAMIERLREWIRLADERYKGSGMHIYTNLGNDDPTYLFDVIKESDVMRTVEGEIIDIGGYEMISFGYVNPTPWNTHREMKEEELGLNLKKMAEKISEPSRSIFNFHAPPYGTNLDNAPLLDSTLKPVVKGGEIVMTHVGSSSVKEITKEFSPLLGIHGHIHESRGFDKIGNTLVLNPGSEFGEGILHSSLIILEDNKVKAHQFIIG